MRTKLEKLLQLLFTIAYYVMGALVFTALIGYFFDFRNFYWNGILKIALIVYGELLILTLLILKIYDLKDNINNKEYNEFLPWRHTNITWLFLYLLLGVTIPLAISQCK